MTAAALSLRPEIDALPVFGQVAEAAAALGHPTYVVGGYVRDLILRRASKDIDFVSLGPGSGIALAEELARRHNLAPPVVYKNFGTAMLRFGELELEFVGARKESYRADSRKPIVEDGSLDDDQHRRDFTINALAISLNNDAYGQVIDTFGGVEDLRNMVIRTPLKPEQTFSDDPLRMLRAIRFASQLYFDIEPATFEAIQQQADRLSIISAERIATELNKIILSPKPSYGFKLLEVSGLLSQFFPEMIDLKGAEFKNGIGHKDNFYHTLQVLDNIAEVSDDLWLRWAAILHDIAKPKTKRFDPKVGWTFHGHEDKGARMVKGIFRRLRLPLGEEMRKVETLVRLHLRPIALVKEEITDSAIRRVIFEAGDYADDLMKLCRADITSKNEAKVKKYLRNFDQVEAKMIEVEEKDRLRHFQPPVSGEDIMEAFGLSPCREIGQIKEVIREAILEGEIPNEREAAWGLMLREGQKLGLTPKA